MSENYVLITGASEGIGRELAEVFAKKQYNLVLTARNEQKLKQIQIKLIHDYNIKVKIISADLALPESPQNIYDFLQKEKIHIDILINNAGFGEYGGFTEIEWQREKSMIQLNITALTELSKLFLPPMLEKNQGKIMNVASTAAFFPGPRMAVYYATKAYVLSFSEALSSEMSGKNITVTALCPGPTESQFSQRARLDSSRLFDNPLMHMMSSKEVAEYGYNALMKGKCVAIPGMSNQLFTQSTRFSPRAAVRHIIRMIMDQRKA